MIILRGAGRFGNQIFQFLFCETIRRPKERVLAMGLGSFLNSVYGVFNYYNIDNHVIDRIFDVVIRRFLEFIAKLHVISFINETNGKLKHTKGFLQVTYINGYFQSDSYYSCRFNNQIIQKQIFQWKPKLVIPARHFIKSECPLDFTPVFIHIRHGDYSDSLRLPNSFYNKTVSLLLNNSTKLHFFIVGDDPVWAEEFFSFLPSKTVSHNNVMTDFLTMTLCDGGIISNSTFAWWGSYLCNHKQPVYAPQFWMDWKNEKWYPIGINTDKFNYIDVFGDN